MYCTFYEYVTSIIHRAVHSVGTQIKLMRYATWTIKRKKNDKQKWLKFHQDVPDNRLTNHQDVLMVNCPFSSGHPDGIWTTSVFTNKHTTINKATSSCYT